MSEIHTKDGIFYKGWTIEEKRRISLTAMFSRVVSYEATGPRGEKLEARKLRDVKQMINDYSRVDRGTILGIAKEVRRAQ